MAAKKTLQLSLALAVTRVRGPKGDTPAMLHTNIFSRDQLQMGREIAVAGHQKYGRI